MRVLMLAVAVLGGSLFVATGPARAQSWGRMYGSGYTIPDADYTQSYYPSDDLYRGSGAYPGIYAPDASRPYYNNGYYNAYNLGYSSGIYAPPYRSYYTPYAPYRGYNRGY
jgi:hypothetical protein